MSLGDEILGTTVARRWRSRANPLRPAGRNGIDDHSSGRANEGAVGAWSSEKPDRYWSAPARTWACRKSSDFSRESWLCQEL
jgi:hypothetical protein